MKLINAYTDKKMFLDAKEIESINELKEDKCLIITKSGSKVWARHSYQDVFDMMSREKGVWSGGF